MLYLIFEEIADGPNHCKGLGNSAIFNLDGVWYIHPFETWSWFFNIESAIFNLKSKINDFESPFLSFFFQRILYNTRKAIYCIWNEQIYLHSSDRHNLWDKYKEQLDSPHTYLHDGTGYDSKLESLGKRQRTKTWN